MTKLDDLLINSIQREVVPGVAIAVVRGDETVATAAAGAADLVSGSPMLVGGACNWFSMTKIVTATMAAMLADRGELDPETPVREILTDIWPTPFAAVRVRHLLNHSSGLSNPIPIRWVHRSDEKRPDARDFLARLLAKQRAPRVEPGAKAAYSNVGYLALGEVIATVARRPYDTVVRDEILRPLAMTSTAFAWDDLPASVPRTTPHSRVPRLFTPMMARLLPRGLLGPRTGKVVALEAFELDGAAYGGLIGTVEDAARIVALHCNGGIVDGTRLLSTRAVESMATITALGKPYDLAMGWFCPHNDPSVHLEHFGGGMGFWNVMRIHPETGYGAIAMSNITRHWNITALADEAIGHVSAGRTGGHRPDRDRDRRRT